MWFLDLNCLLGNKTFEVWKTSKVIKIGAVRWAHRSAAQ